MADAAVAIRRSETRNRPRSTRAGTDQVTGLQRALLEDAYRLHRGEVHGLLMRRLGNDDDAADLTQEAYLRLLQYPCQSADSLRFLLFRTAINLAISHLRHRKLGRSVPLHELDLVAEGPAPDDLFDVRQRMDRLATAFAMLPERCQSMLALRRIDGMRTREVAMRCGLSTRMVEIHITRSVAHLRARVEAD